MCNTRCCVPVRFVANGCAPAHHLQSQHVPTIWSLAMNGGKRLDTYVQCTNRGLIPRVTFSMPGLWRTRMIRLCCVLVEGFNTRPALLAVLVFRSSTFLDTTKTIQELCWSHRDFPTKISACPYYLWGSDQTNKDHSLHIGRSIDIQKEHNNVEMDLPNIKNNDVAMPKAETWF